MDPDGGCTGTVSWAGAPKLQLWEVGWNQVTAALFSRGFPHSVRDHPPKNAWEVPPAKNW